MRKYTRGRNRISGFHLDSVPRSNHIVRHIPRNVVSRHDFLHLAFMLRGAIAITLSTLLQPLAILFVEFVLVVRRQSAAEFTIVIVPGVSVRSGDGFKGGIRGA